MEGQWDGFTAVGFRCLRFHYYIPADGLYSTTASDWLAWETARQPLERAIIAL